VDPVEEALPVEMMVARGGAAGGHLFDPEAGDELRIGLDDPDETVGKEILVSPDGGAVPAGGQGKGIDDGPVVGLGGDKAIHRPVVGRKGQAGMPPEGKISGRHGISPRLRRTRLSLRFRLEGQKDQVPVEAVPPRIHIHQAGDASPESRFLRQLPQGGRLDAFPAFHKPRRQAPPAPVRPATPLYQQDLPVCRQHDHGHNRQWIFIEEGSAGGTEVPLHILFPLPAYGTAAMGTVQALSFHQRLLYTTEFLNESIGHPGSHPLVFTARSHRFGAPGR